LFLDIVAYFWSIWLYCFHESSVTKNLNRRIIMSIEALETRPLKKERIKSRALAKSFMALALSGSMVAACSSPQPSSEASAKPNTTPSSQPKNGNTNTPPTSSSPNNNSSTQNSSVGTPIADLCNVPQLANFMTTTYFNDPSYGSLRCKDSAIALPSDSPGVGNWGQGAEGSGNGKIVIGITLNDNPHSSGLYPAESNVWAKDLSGVSSTPGEQLIPNAVNGQEAIWLNDSDSSESVVADLMSVKFGNYVLMVIDAVTDNAQSQAQCEEMLELTEAYGFSK